MRSLVKGGLESHLVVTEDRDEIVVFQRFDSVIEANVAKTKLDAFDIPCFLTNENLSGLYPGHGAPYFSQPTLHVFKKDTEKSFRILMQRQDSTGEVGHACPKCDSRDGCI